MVDPDLAVRSAIGLDRWARQPALTGGEPGVAMARRRGCIDRRGGAGLLRVALDDGPDLLAADADVGERAVIKRHQFAIGPLPLPPSRDRRAHRHKEIDERHASNSST